MPDIETICERRAFPTQELRAEGGQDSAPAMIVGYAAVFGQYSNDLGGFREMIRPGAFANTILMDDVRALFNHDSNYVLGRNRAGTLRLVEDERGLRIEIDPPDAQWARDLMVSVRRGDVSQMSFQFVVEEDAWQQDGDGLVTRELIRVKLFDVSPVTFPAYPQTSAQVHKRFQEFLSQEAGKTDGEQAGQQALLAIRRKRLELSN